MVVQALLGSPHNIVYDYLKRVGQFVDVRDWLCGLVVFLEPLSETQFVLISDAQSTRDRKTLFICIVP